MKFNRDYMEVMRRGKWFYKELDRDKKYPLANLVFLLLIILMLGIAKCAPAEEYTNNQIVNAIYKAEGGDHAKYPYGIRSIECRSRIECSIVCLNTVKNNRQRYIKYGYKSYSDFIAFLASKYCPIGAGNDPKKLNQNWLKNVRYFLEKTTR